MFKGLSLQEFYNEFKCDTDCKLYLYAIKWGKGFVCKRCESRKAWKGKTAFHKRCQNCGYDESVTANTAFHKIKIPLIKAFGMAFQMSVPKNGKSSNDLRKEFDVNPKTALAFRRKVHRVMESELCSLSGEVLENDLVVDSITITRRGESLNGFQRVLLHLKKKVTALNTKKKFIWGEFSLLNETGIDYSRLVGGRFKEEGASLLAWNFKVWLTGVHHHCSLTYSNGYLAEFLFRYNFRSQVYRIWHRLMERFLCFNFNSGRQNPL